MPSMYSRPSDVADGDRGRSTIMRGEPALVPPELRERMEDVLAIGVENRCSHCGGLRVLRTFAIRSVQRGAHRRRARRRTHHRSRANGSPRGRTRRRLRHGGRELPLAHRRAGASRRLVCSRLSVVLVPVDGEPATAISKMQPNIFDLARAPVGNALQLHRRRGSRSRAAGGDRGRLGLGHRAGRRRGHALVRRRRPARDDVPLSRVATRDERRHTALAPSRMLAKLSTCGVPRPPLLRLPGCAYAPGLL